MTRLRRAHRGIVVGLAAILAAGGVAGCSSEDDEAQKTVVVYVSLDRIHSEPILDEFERKTGIRVRDVYDAESSKSVGLAARLIEGKDDPDCDVHWNNEVVQTARLAREGIYQPYASPNAERMPRGSRHGEGLWTGFAARIRVIIYNTELVPAGDDPTSLADFTDAKWRSKAVMARPNAGTTLTHMAVLYDKWGPQKLSDWCKAALANDMALASGNGPVRDLVARGEKAFGLTDTDDAYAAMQAGKPVAVVIPDASDGAVVIPNTVALVAGCPHPANGKKLIDYLLSAEVEKKLAAGASAQMPLGKDLSDFSTPWDSLAGADNPLEFDADRVAASLPQAMEVLTEAGMDR